MMRIRDRRLNPYDWLTAHAVDVAFGLLAVGWLLYVLRITGELYFWSDELRLIEQAGSWGGLIEPYNGALSLVSLSIYRASAELSDLSYTPFMIAGALSLVAVPVSYYLTTRRQLGPPLAAILAMSLLWYDGMSLRPAGLNHFLALVGGIFCAAALNRGRRADGVLAAALVLSLCSAGGALVVAGACLMHNVLVRPPLRRWLAVLVPSALWACWWVLIADATSPAAREQLTVGQAARVVRDLCYSPFDHAAFGIRPLAAFLLAAFLLHGAMQLRRGLAGGANFLAWSGAMVLWALALVRSRGSFADVHTFRYAYVSLGFALLALVPRQPIRWPEPVALTNRRWLAVAAVIVLVFGGMSGLAVRDGLQEFARRNAELGREAEGTMLVLGLGPDVIPDRRPITFFGFHNPHGSAGQVRALVERYGSPLDATSTTTVDQVLVDLDIVRARFAGRRPHPGCRPLTEPLSEPGMVTRGLGVPAPGFVVAPTPAEPLKLWSSEPFTVDVRRYGDDWVRLADVRAGRSVTLTLPSLNTGKPWEVRADGACDVRS